MSSESKTGMSARADGVTIPFGQKFAESGNFAAVFEEGMALVETTAAYLDGDGRKESRALEPQASLAYATESMRLTTRLMQLASWLLIRRAVNEGEMTPAQAYEEQNKVKFQTPSASTDPALYAALPARLRELNDASLNLLRRVVSIDGMLKAELESGPKDAINAALDEQISRLTNAFGPMTDAAHRRKDTSSGGST